MNGQQAQGTLDQAAGKLKEGIGNLTGDERTRAEGQKRHEGCAGIPVNSRRRVVTPGGARC